MAKRDSNGFGQPATPSVPASPGQAGLVISHLGQGLAVENATGEIILCHTRRRLGDAAVGDRVLWEPCDGNLGRVMEVLPRRSVLTRPGYGGKIRTVAANLDQVLVVTAPEPEPDWLLVDQYLAACEHRNLGAAIILNKIDQAQDRNAIHAALAEYEAVGYACFEVSAKSGEGLPALRAALAGRCNMLAGQSGVGKSSLTNALLPDKQLRTRELSEKANLGRHTTTAATLYHLPDGGNLIDSPGVAVFGLAEMNGQDLAYGFREFRPYLDQCRFRDCRHINDKGCSVRGASEKGGISAGRYQRYLKLLDRLRVGA
ncbi:ribosome small subunit-dependent GTPase A [Methylomagnum sp.]